MTYTPVWGKGLGAIWHNPKFFFFFPCFFLWPSLAWPGLAWLLLQHVVLSST